MYVQSESPGADKESNWLPSPKGADFSLYIRAYWPEEAILNEQWTPRPWSVRPDESGRSAGKVIVGSQDRRHCWTESLAEEESTANADRLSGQALDPRSPLAAMTGGSVRPAAPTGVNLLSRGAGEVRLGFDPGLRAHFSAHGTRLQISFLEVNSAVPP